MRKCCPAYFRERFTRKTFGAGLLTAPKFDDRETFGQAKWHGRETGHSDVLG
jgi:hypothetical protein